MPAKENVSAGKVVADGKRPRISLDTWAVAFALAAALLVKSGLVKHVPW
ncbi:MAG TPA: hypothetical protein VE545_10115 [Candidatus Dormibacteraeota bacterium]|nr:hypothetical protein [Candidatus Dormibacteraeota bacterium]